MSRSRATSRWRVSPGTMMTRPVLIAAGSALTVLGLAAFLLLNLGERGGAPVLQAEQLGFASEQVERASREREVLAGEVEALRARLDRIERQLASSSADIPAQFTSTTNETTSSYGSDDTPTRQPAAFDSERLMRSGIDSREAERLRALWSEIELEKLYAIDQAEREGWSNARRHAELQSIQTSVRDSLDDAAYDRYLFAVQTPNRVVVRDVIDGSPAQSAGIRPGDVILSYDGRRIFGRGELREATSLGHESESVRLELIRDDRVETLTVSSGPIGLLLMSQLHEPR